MTVLAPPWESAVHFGGAKIRLRIALSLGAVGSNTCDHTPRKCIADDEFVDSITVLAPPWGSAIPFGSKDSLQNRALAWSFRSNTGVNSACYLLADGGFVDSITVLAPQWMSAVHFGGPESRLRIARSLGASAQTRE